MNYGVRLYVALLSLLALACTVWLYVSNPVVSLPDVSAAIVFSLIGAVCEMQAYKKGGRNESGSIAFLATLALVVVAPTWFTVLTVSSATAIVQIVKKRAPIKSVFNVAQVTLWVALSVAVYLLLGGERFLGDTVHIQSPAFVAVLVTFAIINSTAVAGAIAISERQSFWKHWWGSARVTVLYDLLTLPFVYAIAWCYVHFGAVGAVGSILPFFGLRQMNKVNWQLEQTNQELLQLMVAAIEARDPYTSGHSRRVSRNARLIAQAIGLRDKQVERVAVAALLHDVGKIHEVFAPILSKPGRLTAEENAIMQTHPVKSEELVKTVSQLSDVVAPIRHHHENWDGTGYPDGIAGEKIPIASRIIMFADTIDAMTTDRPYRAAMGETQVRAEFVKLRGRQFDPLICDKLLSSPIYPRLFDQDVPLTPAIVQAGLRKTPTPSSRLAS
jgi:hypothetical protein